MWRSPSPHAPFRHYCKKIEDCFDNTLRSVAANVKYVAITSCPANDFTTFLRTFACASQPSAERTIMHVPKCRLNWLHLKRLAWSKTYRHSHKSFTQFPPETICNASGTLSSHRRLLGLVGWSLIHREMSPLLTDTLYFTGTRRIQSAYPPAMSTVLSIAYSSRNLRRVSN